jgi:CRP/FNR family transcriptional regulator, cyclic AMP receptor protein
MQMAMGSMTGTVNRTRRPGEFFSKLSSEALEDLESLEYASNYPAQVTLFTEKETPRGVYIVLSGDVKVSMNSMDGKRLILRIARAGEILGLTSAISGGPAEITAQTLHPARIAVVERRDFLGFLARHPEAYQALTVELSRHLNMVCEQLRTVGLSASAPEKLARLLIVWSANGQKTESGTRFHFPLTHEEIGEFIGASRETVTRTLSRFKHRRLVACHGATLTIPSLGALENFARS